MESSADLATMMESVSSPNSVIILGYVLVLSLLPFIAIMASCYIKLVVVFHLLRNALGIQQIPPNLAVNGLAIILTVYVMAPALTSVFETITAADIDLNKPDLAVVGDTLAEASQPIVDFMLKHSEDDERDFFLRASTELWPDSYGATISDRNIMILMPAFIMSELKAAFKIGFLIYMPFVAIDLIVSNILLALGMMMVSPMTISLPFKLLLFVVIDGWTILIHGLVMSYA